VITVKINVQIISQLGKRVVIRTNVIRANADVALITTIAKRALRNVVTVNTHHKGLHGHIPIPPHRIIQSHQISQTHYEVRLRVNL